MIRRAGNEISKPEPMSVRSVRLPGPLWDRLATALEEVNRNRRRPVSLSSLIRALLEEGLDAPLPTFKNNKTKLVELINMPSVLPCVNSIENKTPPVDGSDKKLRSSENDVKPTVTEVNIGLHEQFINFVTLREISCNAFINSVEGDRKVLAAFYHKGLIPSGPVGGQLRYAVRIWMDTQQNSQEL